MPTAIDIARDVFPEASIEELDHIIWERTGFPCFWSLRDGQSVENKIMEQLIDYRMALSIIPHGWHLCDFCNRQITASQWMCYSCNYNKPDGAVVWC